MYECFPFRADFNPRPPCGGRRFYDLTDMELIIISIHAPRAGGDRFYDLTDMELIVISIHAPRAGGDSFDTDVAAILGVFQSTPPVRGATPRHQRQRHRLLISIHAPRAGGDTDLTTDELTAMGISIHAPRAGGDQTNAGCRSLLSNFNPRPPCGGRLFSVYARFRT